MAKKTREQTAKTAKVAKAAKVAKPAKAAPELPDAYKSVVDAFIRKADVTGGLMMASYGLRVNGKIFVMFPRGTFVVKLPKPRVEALVASGDGQQFDPGHGRLMKEWVVVQNLSLDLIGLAKEAYDFVKRGTK
jgi:hypothetical protein